MCNERTRVVTWLLTHAAAGSGPARSRELLDRRSLGASTYHAWPESTSGDWCPWTRSLLSFPTPDAAHLRSRWRVRAPAGAGALIGKLRLEAL